MGTSFAGIDMSTDTRAGSAGGFQPPSGRPFSRTAPDKRPYVDRAAKQAMSPRQEFRLTTWGTISSGSRKIEIDWYRLASVGVSFPISCLSDEASHRRRSQSCWIIIHGIATEHMTPPSVFLSYAHADSSFAHQLAAALGDREVPVWVDQHELRIGDSVIERISRAVAGGDFLLAIVSPSSLRSAWCQRELAWAATRGIDGQRVVVLPIRYRGAKMPPSLADRFWADGDNTDLAALADRIAQDIDRHRGAGPPRNREAWLRSTLRAVEIESAAMQERCTFHLQAAEKDGRTRVRVDGSVHYAAADRLARLGVFQVDRMSGSWVFFRMTDRGRDLLAALRASEARRTDT
jgi:hypothetical protein